jgi:membrane-associated phospholipid phosphatase
MPSRELAKIENMSIPVKWLNTLALTAILIAISYQWLDRPIAFLAHEHVRSLGIFGPLGRKVPELVPPLAGLALIAVTIRTLAKRPLSHFEATILLCGLSFFIAEGIKTYLKVAFGRTWPETWIYGNPSLIDDGVYGFNPFHGGFGYTSFPSGHTTAVCAVVSVLWVCYPKWRSSYLLFALAISVGLVAANYHFLSDVIAGAYLGASVGWAATTMWNAGIRSSPERQAPPIQECKTGNGLSSSAEAAEPLSHHAAQS